jgi:hypothetical protein
MRGARTILALLAAVPLVLAVASPVSAHHDRGVPFRMHVAGVDQPLNMAPGIPPDLTPDLFAGRCSVPSTWVTTIDSAGRATHLGKVSVTQSHCTQFDFLATPPVLAPFGDGRMVITAADGDQLWLRYRGSFLFYPGATPDVGVSKITYSSMTIVGGTGRFRHATGWMVGTAVDNFPAGPNTADFHGRIVYGNHHGCRDAGSHGH